MALQRTVDLFLVSPTSKCLKVQSGAARGKSGPTGIRGVLCNNKSGVLFMFSKFVGVSESNEAEVLSILEALKIFYSTFKETLIVESDSSNAISWVSKVERVFGDFNIISMRLRVYLLQLEYHSLICVGQQMVW